MAVFMKCGHIAIGRDEEGNPVCPICLCWEIDPNAPDLAGRKAKCPYCGAMRDEINADGEPVRLPFFRYQPDMEYDTFYDGCYGWD